jgi:NAD+ kinase
MLIGIDANTNKAKVYEVISALVKSLKENGFDYLLMDTISEKGNQLLEKIPKNKFAESKKLCKKSDMIISIGGDGTMLTTAYWAQFHNKPVLGVNLGKLGFLAEVNINQMDTFIKEIKDGNYEIEERMIISGECIGHQCEKLYGINDIVIDKGGWPKMIELEINIGGKYVTTFSADGLIVATPTGSTGYSISTGGPIVSPKADVITLSPISPHSLTMRPIVLPGNDEIKIKTSSFHKELLVNCDGQRVFAFPPPLEIKIKKSERPFKLVHTSLTNYFETLRSKLLWGIDLRKNFL